MESSISQKSKFTTYTKQFDYYRGIYDRAIDARGIRLTFATTYVDGLFDILKYGFDKVYDFISSDDTPGRDKKTALANIKTLYTLAEKINAEGKLSQLRFIVLNLFMARFVDQYKGITTKELPNVDRYNINVIKDTLSSGDFSVLSEYGNEFGVTTFTPFIAVIYKGKSHISPKTFVDQVLATPYGVGVVLFDVQAMPYTMRSGDQDKPGTKTDPHYSQFNTTLGLLKHDFAHISEQQHKIDYFFKTWKIDIPKNLKDINKIRLSLEKEDSNKYKILTNGLFILSHELFNVSTWIDNKALSKPLSFVSFVTAIKNSMKKTVELYPRVDSSSSSSSSSSSTKGDLILALKYKQDYRDHEEILKDVTDKNGKPLKSAKDEWESLSASAKTQIIVDGYEKFWNYFLEIVGEYGS